MSSMSDPAYADYERLGKLLGCDDGHLNRAGDEIERLRWENAGLHLLIAELRADNETLRQMLKTLTEADPQYGRHALEGK